MSSPSAVAVGTRELTMAQAVNEALREELERDPTVFVIGEDVAEAGTPFKVMAGLVEEFGPERVVDSPISEPGIAGLGLGAAMTGMRPVVDIMFGDFLTLIMDQVVNQAAKIHYMSGGSLKAPLTIRTTLGATRRSAAQHSQSLHAWVAHVPGLKVCLPATPADAKGLYKSAIRDDNPVVLFEDKMNFTTKGPVPDGEHLVPIGVADVKRAGEDVTMIATSSMLYVALAAAEELDAEGVSVEVVDPRTIAPLDAETLVASARKTGRVLVLDEGHRSYGASAEIAAAVSEGAFWHLDAPVRRLAAMDVPIPFSPVLEDETVPTPERAVDAALELVGKKR
jgi:pyruvate dehydrogenase E1 component beta subunit